MEDKSTEGGQDWPQHVGINVNIFLLVRILTNNKHKLKYNKTDHKTLFTLGTNSYMFRHQGAIRTEFIKKMIVSPTHTSGAHFTYSVIPYSCVGLAKVILCVIKLVNSFCLLGISNFMLYIICIFLHPTF